MREEDRRATAREDLQFSLVGSRRIDVKLYRREPASGDASPTLLDNFLRDGAEGVTLMNTGTSIDRSETLDSSRSSSTSSKVDVEIGYMGIGIVGAKTEHNVGSLWRSAFQLGAQFIFTVGHRYTNQASDTLLTHKRLPLFEFPTWRDFAASTPKGAAWVAIEMGG